MRKRLIGSLVVLALSAPVGIALSATSAEATTTYYSSCTKLHVKFKHGVAKSAAAAQRQVNQGYGRPAYGTLAKQVYWKNHSRLDRDNDGTACEA